MTDFESASNQALTGALLSLSIGVCFREQISKIKNFHLSGSIWIALMFYFLYGLSSAVLEREYAISPPSTSLFNSVYFAALSYHTSYRALILLFPQMEQRLWLIAGAVAFIEFSLNMLVLHFHCDGVLFIRNLEADFGMIPDPNEQRTSITLMVYVISTDTIFFLDSQARIITGMADGANTKVLAWHYLDAFLRCVCYSGAVFLYFVTSARNSLFSFFSVRNRRKQLHGSLKTMTGSPPTPPKKKKKNAWPLTSL
ncbi:hypothetical protein DFJ73DRAFT_843144, partial [Zopfochytrium polystomum]